MAMVIAVVGCGCGWLVGTFRNNGFQASSHSLVISYLLPQARDRLQIHIHLQGAGGGAEGGGNRGVLVLVMVM